MGKSMQDLRPGWRRVKFGEVVTQCKEGIEPGTNNVMRYVAGEHMGTDCLKIRRWGVVGDGYLGPAFHRFFRAGQVLYGSRRTYLRKVAVADFDGVCANTTFVLESKDPAVLYPSLLPFIMQTEAFTEHSVKQSRGSVNPYVNFSDLAWYEFLLPPLIEQEQIYRCLAEVESAIQTLQDALDAAEKVRKATLFDLFDNLQANGRVHIPALGLSVPCEQVRVDRGGSVLMGRQLSPKYKTGVNPRPYLRVANVFDGYIDASEVFEMDFSDAEFQAYRLQAGDVLLNEGQSRELVGRSAIFRDEVKACCFQNTLIRFRASDSVMPEYAHFYFQYCQYTGRFAQISKQTTSIAHLGVQRFSEMRFPLVDLGVQEQIVNLVGAVTSSIQGLAARMEAAKKLKAAILREVWGA